MTPVLHFRVVLIAVLLAGALIAQAPPPQLAPNIYYNGDLHFRVVYPANVERSEWVADYSRYVQGDDFTIKAPSGAVLYGRVVGDAVFDHTPAEHAQEGIDNLKNGRLQNARESKGWAVDQRPPDFKVTLNVIRDDWYAFSGIQGANIFYEKGVTGERNINVATALRVHMQYPASTKQYFDPIVTQIARSLESFVYFTAKVQMVDRGQKGGSLRFAAAPYDSINVRTVCYFSEADAPRFNKLSEGQTIAVAGRYDFVNLSKNSREQFYETSIKSCVLVDPKTGVPYTK